jgi:hypothetical protein
MNSHLDVTIDGVLESIQLRVIAIFAQKAGKVFVLLFSPVVFLPPHVIIVEKHL